jgi:hypothetical protein
VNTQTVSDTVIIYDANTDSNTTAIHLYHTVVGIGSFLALGRHRDKPLPPQPQNEMAGANKGGKGSDILPTFGKYKASYTLRTGNGCSRIL